MRCNLNPTLNLKPYLDAVQVKAFDVLNQRFVHASVDFSSEVAAGQARVTLPGA